MDNIANLSNTSEEYNTSELPTLAVIYTPIFLVQLLVGLVSNILLLTLLVKATSVKNNINVYLYSMAANNLLSLFLLLTLVVSTVIKQWVFGQTMCTINQFILYMVSIPNLLVPDFISRERYRAVLHFMEWNPLTRRTYLEVGVVWICAVAVGTLGILQAIKTTGDSYDVILCYAPSGWRSTYPLYTVCAVLGATMSMAALFFCVIQYSYIFREFISLRGATCTPVPSR